MCVLGTLELPPTLPKCPWQAALFSVYEGLQDELSEYGVAVGSLRDTNDPNPNSNPSTNHSPNPNPSPSPNPDSNPNPSQFSSLELVGAAKAFEGFTREAPLTLKRMLREPS